MHTCSRGCCEGPDPKTAQAKHFRSVTMATAQLVVGNRKDRRLSRDLAAYKRLRENNIQPTTIDGAARVEAHSETKEQVEQTPPPPRGGW